jgi:hypothetical protein
VEAELDPTSCVRSTQISGQGHGSTSPGRRCTRSSNDPILRNLVPGREVTNRKPRKPHLDSGSQQRVAESGGTGFDLDHTAPSRPDFHQCPTLINYKYWFQHIVDKEYADVWRMVNKTHRINNVSS